MIGNQLGPYRIESELGSGGMGTVYRATDDAGQCVAVKVIHPHLLATPGFFKRFLREAELGRKVTHENVVRTLDADALLVDKQQVNFMVMEYVEGRSLRELLTDLGTIPETLLREIARQTAAGLAAIHAEGIVHRDLKPENVLITDAHEIRIMDLGVAKLQEASVAITMEGQFAGSLLHAAPEQFKQGEVGPAADLYSLGVLLHELATGDNPFRRDDAAQVIDAQLNFQPARITERNPDLTTFFAELVATLLAKQPVERFASADELRDVLAEAEGSAWWTELAPKLRKEVAHLPRIRVRRETKLHGRDQDLATLNDAWKKARSGVGYTILVEGEAGIGKTRLLDAFVRGLDEDVHILYGSYPPSGGLGGISDAILDKFGEVDLTGSLAPYLTVTPSLVPAFAALIKHESPPTGSEALQGDALNAVVVHLMRALAEEKPTLWMVDDLHFASRESRDLALSLARAVEGHRVLLICTARPGIPDEELAHLTRLENIQRIALARLSGREIIDLLEDAFKSEALAEKLGVKIVKKSDGVPFFVFEMIRGLREGQFIKELPDGSYVQTQVIDEIEVPSAVKDLIEGRLRGLQHDQRRILDVGAVMGMAFSPDLVGAVLEEKRVRVLEQLAQVERLWGLVQGEADHTRFDQNQIQEVLYADLTPALRAEYHTLLAEAYGERLEGEPTGESAVFLASHHLRGSRPARGLPYLIPALDYLEQCCRSEPAIEVAARALGTAGLLEGKERVEVLLKRAWHHDMRGERDLERAALDEALALADKSADPTLRAQARVARARFLVRIAETDAARECAEEALAIARDARDKEREAAAAGVLGVVCHAQGRFEQARPLFEKHLAMAREIGDRQGEAAATGNLGTILMSQGYYEEARAQYEQHLALAREIGSRNGECTAMGNLAFLLNNLGRYEEARAQHEKHLALAREIGNRNAEGISLVGLGLVAQNQGRYDEARAQHEKYLALAREIGDRQGEGVAMGNLGNLLSAQGRYDEARAQNERWLALAREIGDRANEAMATGNLGNALSALGRYGEALAQYGAHLALARELGDRQAEGIALVNIGPLQAALGQTESAHQTLLESLEVLRGIGARRPEGYALESLGKVAEQCGDEGEARRFYEDALALRREIAYPSGVASTLIALAQLEASQGDEQTATEHIEEALSLAGELQRPTLILAATIERAHLPGGKEDAARAALEEHEKHAHHTTKMHSRFRLWELTKDKTHLAEAKRLLDSAVAHSPEDCRNSMIENVPLHRDIVAAWEEHGGA